MATRLNVIMAHSTPAEARSHRFTESVVGELIGRPGIDVTLINSLDVADQSTDAVTLESLSSDVAALDWRSPAAMVAQLNSIGFAGQRAPHCDDPNVDLPAIGERKIYAFDLSTFADAKSLCRALEKLRESREIKTVSIAGLSAPGQRSRSTSQSAPSPTRATTNPTSPTTSKGAITAAEPVVSALESNKSMRQNEIDLDDLVDQLDELDP